VNADSMSSLSSLVWNQLSLLLNISSWHFASKFSIQLIKTVSLFIKTLELDEWDLSAIDYHTNSNFIDFIIKKFPELTKQDIQNIIWIASSSINTRILNNSNNNNIFVQENWIKIKLYVEKIQKYLLESNI